MPEKKTFFRHIADARKHAKNRSGRTIVRRLSSTERKAHKGKLYKVASY